MPICKKTKWKHYYTKDVRRAAASLIWNHLHGRQGNLVFAGPTECGKTAIWQAAAKICPDIHIFDASHVTADGWSGSQKIQDLFAGLDAEQAERGIYVLDESDKIFAPVYGAEGSNYSLLVQNELLKMIEGGSIHYPPEEKTKRKEINLKTDHKKGNYIFQKNRTHLPYPQTISGKIPWNRKSIKKKSSFQEEMKEFYGNIYQNKKNYVFCWDDGHPYDPDYLTKRFTKAMTDFGMPRVTPHSFCSGWIFLRFLG